MRMQRALPYLWPGAGGDVAMYFRFLGNYVKQSVAARLPLQRSRTSEADTDNLIPRFASSLLVEKELVS